MIKLYHVDAFAHSVYQGNPAAVCLLDQEIDEHLMQSIAFENNLSETAFILRKNGDYTIRWFTPTVEVDLCGHATLASAHTLFSTMNTDQKQIKFESKKHGLLTVDRDGSIYTLDFPADHPKKIELPILIQSMLGDDILDVYRSSTDFIAVLKNEDQIQSFKPDLDTIRQLDSNGLVITAPGNSVDFVSRYFAPQIGINEDPVTGAIHTALVPLWSEKLTKNKLSALQLSERGGALGCMMNDTRVRLSGEAITFSSGTIYV